MIKIKKSIALFAVKIETLRTLEYHLFLKKGEFLLSFAVNLSRKMKRYLKKKNQSRY